MIGFTLQKRSLTTVWEGTGTIGGTRVKAWRPVRSHTLVQVTEVAEEARWTWHTCKWKPQW